MDNELQYCLKCKAISVACKKLKKEELVELSKSCIDGEIKKGETFLRQGSITSYVVYVKTGLVKETMTGLGEQDQIFKLLKDGSYLGMSSLFSGSVHHFSYTALSDLSICYIEQNTFERLMKKNGEFAYDIMVTLCKDNVKGSLKLLNQSQKKIYGRVADALLYFSDVIFNKKKFKQIGRAHV